MTDDSGFLNRLRSRGEEVLTQVAAELSQNPTFTRAMGGALRGKEKLEKAVARVLRQMNVPSRGELQRALARIEALERDLAALKRKGGAKAAPPRRSKRAAAPKSAK